MNVMESIQFNSIQFKDLLACHLMYKHKIHEYIHKIKVHKLLLKELSDTIKFKENKNSFIICIKSVCAYLKCLCRFWQQSLSFHWKKIKTLFFLHLTNNKNQD